MEKKKFIKPQLSLLKVDASDIICSSLGGVEDPNKPALVRENFSTCTNGIDVKFS